MGLFGLTDGNLDILKGQGELIGIELLGFAPETGPLEFADKVFKPGIVGGKIPTFCFQMRPCGALALQFLRLRQGRLDLGRKAIQIQR